MSKSLKTYPIDFIFAGLIGLPLRSKYVKNHSNLTKIAKIIKNHKNHKQNHKCKKPP